MMGSAAFKGKIQVNVASGGWSEVGGVENAPPQLSKAELNTSSYGDTGNARIQGLADGTIDIECNLDVDDAGQTALRGAYTSGDLAVVEVAPNELDSGTTLVVAFTARVFNINFGSNVTDKNTVTYQLMLADGIAPTFETALSS